VQRHVFDETTPVPELLKALRTLES
jgi:hypothetical protein